LPRERSEDAAPLPTRDNEARAEQRKEDDKKAQEQAAQKLQLQEVLSNVWKASAAVVDVVLRREAASVASAQGADGAALAPLAGTPSVNDQVITAEEADQLPANVIGLPVAARRDEEPLMYTEQGTSSWAPLESGSLLSRRV
jgi:2-hydroxychromene-2-carboxylate isomerase